MLFSLFTVGAVDLQANSEGGMQHSWV